MNFEFVKMNGLGNDFVIFDNRKDDILFDSDFFIELSDRRTGIGCDQVIIIDNSDNSDIFMHIYNQNGSISGSCGNALRCIGHLYMTEQNINSCNIETLSGRFEVYRVDNNCIKVNMGKPKTSWKDIPLVRGISSDKVSVDIGINFKDRYDMDITTGYCVNFGNPHIVFICKDAEKINLEEVGSLIENYSLFPEGINVNFISSLGKNSIRMRVWERGGMITQACGSGASASFEASFYYGLISDYCDVVMDGGILRMTHNDLGEVLMCGSYCINFTGIYNYV